MNTIKNLFFIISIIGYYLLESFVLALFVNAAWKFVLQPKFDIELTYLNWVAILWISKILLFDIFKVGSYFSDSINLNKDKNIDDLNINK